MKQRLVSNIPHSWIQKWNIKMSAMNADNTADCCAAMVQTQIDDKLQQKGCVGGI